MDTIDTILKVSRRIENGRSLWSVFEHFQGECNELEYEVLAEVSNPDDGMVPGPDGVLGEAVDVILCAVDLIYKSNPNITKEEIQAIVIKKLEKWERIYG